MRCPTIRTSHRVILDTCAANAAREGLVCFDFHQPGFRVTVILIHSQIKDLRNLHLERWLCTNDLVLQSTAKSTCESTTRVSSGSAAPSPWVCLHKVPKTHGERQEQEQAHYILCSTQKVDILGTDLMPQCATAWALRLMTRSSS